MNAIYIYIYTYIYIYIIFSFPVQNLFVIMHIYKYIHTRIENTTVLILFFLSYWSCQGLNQKEAEAVVTNILKVRKGLNKKRIEV